MVEFFDTAKANLLLEFENTAPDDKDRRELIHYRLAALRDFDTFVTNCITNSRVATENMRALQE